MPVWSHSREKDGVRVGSKLLIDHLQGVRDKAFQNKFQHLSFSDNGSLDELLETICWLHDLGKFTTYFQTYLLRPEDADRELKQHSAFGAFGAFNYLESKNSETALLAWYLIKMHHANLRNLDEAIEPDGYWEPSHREIFDKQREALNPLEDLLEVFKLEASHLKFLSADDLYAPFKKDFKRKAAIERFFKVNYLFSLLIEADKLDASDSSVHKRKSINPASVDERKGFGKPVVEQKPLKEMSQNQLRNFVRNRVVGQLDNPEILNKRIFTLAAPTGIGKTMTALDFMLKLRARIEKQEGYLPQIIYGLPFINIIEQALSEYEKTIGDQVKVLGHYQFADVFGKDEAPQYEDEIKGYAQKKMEWDTWQSDVVITSFVQFFETLIGYRNKLVKKFHHLAGSFIVLDEVQTLALEKLPLIGAALMYCCKFLNARVLIMTATQPKLFELMERELGVSLLDEGLETYNLLPEAAEVFACFNRTCIVPIEIETHNEPSMDYDKFTDFFANNWISGKSCLIVVNKVQTSIELYQKFERFFGDEGIANPIHYLSTNITPVQRERTIEQLRDELKNGFAPVLIATQVVEAGVDLDFDLGFRDLGPVDSIVQVAGRINRENDPTRSGAPLFVVDFGDCRRIYGAATDSQAKLALSGIESIEEKKYKTLVESYFEGISDSDQADFSESREIFSAMAELRYDLPGKGRNAPTTVSDFRIIEERENVMSVFVESQDDPEATEVREAFEKLRAGELSKEEFDKKYKRTFNQRIITVPDYYEKSQELKKEKPLSDYLQWIKPVDWSYYYDERTGFIRQSKEENAAMVL